MKEIQKLPPQLIDKYLDQMGITDFDLKLELNDHISSIIEFKMETENENDHLAFMGYEIKNLVGEIKEEINTKSKKKLIKILVENFTTTSFAVVIFIACICQYIMSFSNGFHLFFTYVFLTPLTILIYLKTVKNEISSNDYYTNCLMNNSLIPFLISAGVGMLTLIGSVIIYTKFFGGFQWQVIGSIVSSLAFGCYIKTIFDTFSTIPKLIKNEVNDIEHMKSFISGLKPLLIS